MRITDGPVPREVNRFFASGPFASAPSNSQPKLRLMPSPTRPGSPFLTRTRIIVDALVSAGHVEMVADDLRPVSGAMAEIFPTLFMAAMLPPHPYLGKRADHTDDLWLRLVGRRDPNGKTVIAAPLVRYGDLIDEVEAAPNAIGTISELLPFQPSRRTGSHRHNGARSRRRCASSAVRRGVGSSAPTLTL